MSLNRLITAVSFESSVTSVCVGMGSPSTSCIASNCSAIWLAKEIVGNGISREEHCCVPFLYTFGHWVIEAPHSVQVHCRANIVSYFPLIAPSTTPTSILDRVFVH